MVLIALFALLGALARAAAPEPASDAPEGAAVVPISLDAAVDQALAKNFRLRVERHGLAGAQSSVRAQQNQFDFKLTTRFQHFDELRHGTVFVETSPGVIDELFRDVRIDEERFTVTLDREARWGGKFSFQTELARATDRFREPDPLYGGAVDLTYTQPVWGGAGRRVATEALVAAETSLRGTARSLARDQMSLVVDVTRAYYDVARDRVVIRIDRDAVARAEENLRTYRVRLEEGLITPIDVARAESELRQREDVVVQDEERFRSGRDRLAFLLGLPVATELEVEDSRPELTPLTIELDDALAEARANRADLHDQRDAVMLAELSSHVARSNTRPRLDLALSVGATATEGGELHDWGDLEDDNTWHAGVDFAYTFGERGDDEALVQALIGETQARVELESLERSIELEVRDALRQIRSLERRIDLLSQNLDLARESLRLAQLQLQEDLIRTTDLLQIQDDVVRAETDYAQAIAEHAVARVNLDLVLGRYRVAEPDAASEFLAPDPAVAPVYASPEPRVHLPVPPESVRRPRPRKPATPPLPASGPVQ